MSNQPESAGSSPKRGHRQRQGDATHQHDSTQPEQRNQLYRPPAEYSRNPALGSHHPAIPVTEYQQPLDDSAQAESPAFHWQQPSTGGDPHDYHVPQAIPLRSPPTVWSAVYSGHQTADPATQNNNWTGYVWSGEISAQTGTDSYTSSETYGHLPNYANPYYVDQGGEEGSDVPLDGYAVAQVAPCRSASQVVNHETYPIGNWNNWDPSQMYGPQHVVDQPALAFQTGNEYSATADPRLQDDNTPYDRTIAFYTTRPDQETLTRWTECLHRLDGRARYRNCKSEATCRDCSMMVNLEWVKGYSALINTGRTWKPDVVTPRRGCLNLVEHGEQYYGLLGVGSLDVLPAFDWLQWRYSQETIVDKEPMGLLTESWRTDLKDIYQDAALKLGRGLTGR